MSPCRMESTNRAIGTCAAVLGSGYVPDIKLYNRLYTNAKNIGVGPSSTDDWRALEGRCVQDLEVVLGTLKKFFKIIKLFWVLQ